MKYTSLLSSTAGGGSPNNSTLRSPNRYSQDMAKAIADRNKPTSPMQPANIPGRSTPQRITPAKTYVMPQPVKPRQEQQPVAVSQPPVQYQAPAQAPAPQVQTTQPPAFTGYNWSGVQGLSGQPASFRTNVEAMTLPQLQAYINARSPGHPSRMAIEGIMAQAQARFAPPPPPVQPSVTPPVTPPGTPPPPPPVQYQPGPAGVNVPLPHPQSIEQTMTQMSQDPFYQDVKKFLPDIKSEGLLEILNLLQNRQTQRENLQTLQRGEATMGMQGNDPYTQQMNELRSQLGESILGRLNTPTALPGQDTQTIDALRSSLMGGLQGAGQDQGVAEALRSSLLNSLNNPGALGQGEYEAMQAQARNAGYQSRDRNLNMLRESLAGRGIEGGLADSMLLQAGMSSDASTNQALQDLAIQRALDRQNALGSSQDRLQGYLNASGARNQGLIASQGALQSFLSGQQADALNRYGMESTNRLNDISAGSGILGQDYGQRNNLAQMIAMQQLVPEDWGNLISTYSVGHRPIPQQSGDRGTDWASILGVAGNLGLGAAGLYMANPALAARGFGGAVSRPRSVTPSDYA